MKIALSHYRVGETDGVSLEMDKWAWALEELGHEVVYIAGSGGTCNRETYIIDEIALSFPEDEFLRMQMYFYQDKPESELIARSNTLKLIVKEKLTTIIKEENIDILVPNNICCMGRSIPIGEAYAEVIAELNLKVVNHHHDFYWERPLYNGSNYPFVKQSLNDNFPPSGPNIQHCVINTIAKDDMMSKKQLAATYVPNVFDFDGKLWSADNYNESFRSDLGVGENDILFLQATRIVARKGIELAVDVIENIKVRKEELIGKTLYNGVVVTEDTRIVFAMVGLHEDHSDYVELLEQKCIESGIDFIIDSTLVAHERTTHGTKKIYSLWDAYVFSDFIMYSSIYEGWGNQLLEAVFAKKPMLVFEYSVYTKDIEDEGFDFVSLGNSYETLDSKLVKVDDSITIKAADEIIEILIDKEKYTTIGEHNFVLGKNNFSYDTLISGLKNVFGKAETWE